MEIKRPNLPRPAGFWLRFWAWLFDFAMLTIALAKRVDHAWKLVRRAAGHRQERGALERIFAISVAVAFVIFTVWFLVVQGPGPSLAPSS